MTYFVYMLKCVSSVKKKTYVGYTIDINKILKLHNNNKGAKYTKGNQWIVIYKKRFYSKSKAMSYEYILKHDRKRRMEIYKKNK